jgi:dolichol kinase
MRFQPWRKLFHAASGLVIAAGLTWLPLSDLQATLALGTIAAALIVFDVVRLRSRGLNALFFRAFSRLASPREATGLASSSWYAIGAMLAVAFFERNVAVSAVLVLALADPVASYVGVRWGRRPLLGGTVAGTIAFLVVASVLLILRHPAAVALPSALVTTLAERRAWPLDDNLAVPVACAIALAVSIALT